MKRDLTTVGLALALVMPVALAACGKDDCEDFRDGVPLHEDVTLAFPGGEATTTTAAVTAADGTTVARSSLLGAESEFYKMTRDITKGVNAGTVAVLTLVMTITDYPPTTVAMDMAVWGPYTQPLSQNTWRLTVNRDPAVRGHFSYVFEAKPRAMDDSTYVTVLSGHHVMAHPGLHRRLNQPAFGHGDFMIDWDAASTLPEHDNNVGKAAFTYRRE